MAMQNLGLDEEIIRAASRAAMEAHRNPQSYLVEPVGGSVEIFAFRGSWSENDWVAGGKDEWGLNDWLSDKETTVEPIKNSNNILLQTLPSLRSVGKVEVAKVNEAFFNRFLSIKDQTDFSDKVKKALQEKKQLIFTGHSGAGPVAIFAAIWSFELRKADKTKPPLPPFCLTFGSPLAGNFILNHALRREKWSDNFIHFVNRYDIVPRVFLARPSFTKDKLQQILPFFGNNSIYSDAARIQEFFETVLQCASCVASEAACSTMGSTNMLHDTISSFIDLSPYQPFGTYIFCSGNGRFVVVKNADAVLQMLVYASQLSSEEEAAKVASLSLKQHLTYQDELNNVQENVYYHFKDFIPGEDREEDEAEVIDEVLNEPSLDDLGLSPRARLCLLAAREWEKQKKLNQQKHESKTETMERLMKELKDYRANREASGVGYYDGFKKQDEEEDFRANIKRLELAGIWDEILEQLKAKRRQLPDEFEGDEVWIVRGTEYRRLVEPLDIANYYRHSKGKDSKEYLRAGSRPKRYFYTQRWLEHDEQMEELSSESTFWAVVEELKIKMNVKKQRFGEVKDDILELEKNLKKWYNNGKVQKDAFLKDSTLVEFWGTLPPTHKNSSCINGIINGNE